MNHFLGLTLVTYVLFLISCNKDLSSVDDQKKSTLRSLSAQESVIVESSQDFSLKLFEAISDSQPDSNLFISPFSVSTALSMALNGASGGTYTDIQNTIEVSGLSEVDRNLAYKTLHELLSGADEQVIFEIANSMWYADHFNILAEFVKMNQDYFFAEVAAMDFSAPSALDIINGWVNEKTHGKIDKILDYIPADAVLYIINAIYFKAMWLYEFDKDYTKEENFYITPQTPIQTPMMKTTADLKYFQDNMVQIVELPYGQGNFNMTVFLPLEGISLNDFISQLDGNQWDGYLSQLQTLKGTVSFPKLKMEYKLLMNDVLKQLGMAVAFGSSADFSRIRTGGGIYISRVIHKTFVEIDEEGTEAAAVTLIEFREVSSGGEPELDFFMNVNRPFMFVIRENETGTILFMGKIIQPVWQE